MMKSSIQFALAVLMALVASSMAFQSTPLPKATQHNLRPLFMSEVQEEAAKEEEPAKPDVPCPDCDMCDGSGRIAGGIGAVLPWIPIKAFRPCPRFVERGGSYQRKGQALDEIAFGRERAD